MSQPVASVTMRHEYVLTISHSSSPGRRFNEATPPGVR